MASALDDLYRELILDHYRRPRHRGRIEPYDAQAQGYNPLCGDDLTLWVRLEDGRVAAVGTESNGCSISQASASMMSERIVGMTLPEVEQLIGAFKGMMLQGAEPDPDLVGDLEALQGVKRYPVRIKCALLAWNTLIEAIERTRGESGGRPATSE
ncbi:MAG: SUF system NifU family Fe-S cluster assembly protein [Chloroflexi bacterium]|nr:SUF system NifU family Fe-S cluster assembly protein [Chloroflexota bacterium]